MGIGVTELLIILGIVLLLFGIGVILLGVAVLLFGGDRIKKMAGDLGGGMRAFREGLKDSKVAETKPED